jgi:periplasmic divalent cation tolerance protein
VQAPYIKMSVTGKRTAIDAREEAFNRQGAELRTQRARRTVMRNNGGRYRIVFVTCGSIGEARRIGKSVVEKKLAACANIFKSGVESVYRWKGKLERAREVLVMIKTTSGGLRELEREVKRMHSYDVPEFIVLPIIAGSREYLAWLGQSVVGAGKS